VHIEIALSIYYMQLHMKRIVRVCEKLAKWCYLMKSVFLVYSSLLWFPYWIPWEGKFGQYCTKIELSELRNPWWTKFFIEGDTRIVSMQRYRNYTTLSQCRTWQTMYLMAVIMRLLKWSTVDNAKTGTLFS